MQPILDREQVRELDRWAVEQGRVPSLLLMENAGRGAAEAVAAEVPPRGDVLVVCGPGNNGGDGFVLARRLMTLGRRARVVLLQEPERYAGDAKTNLEAWRALGGELLVASNAREVNNLRLEDAALIVDAMFGTGLCRPLSGHYARAVDRLNQAGRPCVALDLPSGLDADTGRIWGCCVRARRTLTFAHLKVGLLSSNGLAHAGRVRVIDIGIPASCHERVGRRAWSLEASDVERWLTQRPRPRHKGAAGRVVVFAGSVGFHGAAKLVALGCLRAGAGLVNVATFEPAATHLAQDVWEAMVRPLSETNLLSEVSALLAAADAAVIGPGWSLSEPARRVVDHVVSTFEGPVVVDADAVSHYAGNMGDLTHARSSCILTPHPGEAARLLGASAACVEADRLGALAQIVEETRQTVILKGERSCVGAPGELPWINEAQSAVLATPGSGDVLSGIVAALACHLDPLRAALSATYLHGYCGQQWERANGTERGALARDIANGIPAALASLQKDPRDALSLSS